MHLTVVQSSAPRQSTRTRATRKTRPEEAPFEFKATSIEDVVENLAWPSFQIL